MTTIKIEFPVEVGEATVNKKTYQVALNEIPNASLVKIFSYGLQRIVNDKCGGSDKDDEEKDRLATERIASILDGTVAIRTSRSESDPLARYIRGIIREHLTGKAKEKYADLADTASRYALLDEIFTKQSEDAQNAIRALATQRKEIADEARKRTAQLATDGMTIDL